MKKKINMIGSLFKVNPSTRKPVIEKPAEPKAKLVPMEVQMQTYSVFTAINIIADNLQDVIEGTDIFRHQLKPVANSLLQAASKLQEVLNPALLYNDTESVLQFADEANMQAIAKIIACITKDERAVMKEILADVFLSPEVVTSINISEYIAIVNKKNSIITASAKILDRNRNLKLARESKGKKTPD